MLRTEAALAETNGCDGRNGISKVRVFKPAKVSAELLP